MADHHEESLGRSEPEGSTNNSTNLNTNLSRRPTSASTIVAEKVISEPRSSVSRTPSPTEPPKFGLAREAAFVATIVSAQLLTQACLAQSVAPAHIIGASFGTENPGSLSWLAAGFSLTVGTFILPAGRWGDLYGHKKMVMAGYTWFGVWSLVAGFSVWSRSLPFFAFCRAMQGIGPAIVIPNSIAIVARTYPPGPRQGMIMSIFGATAPGGFVLGAVFSGIFAQLAWWPWGYWVLGIVLAIMVVVVYLVIPDLPVAGDAPKVEEFDPIGTLLGVSSLVLFNFAWNQGAAAGWEKVYVYVLLIVGVLILAIFLWYELSVASFPLLDREAFTRDTSLVFGCIAAGWASFGIWMWYFWQFLEVLEGDSILLTAAKASPVAISGATAAIVTGLIIGRVQPGFIMLIAMTSFCVGNILVATNPVGRPYWAQFFVSTLIITWGMDMSFPSGVIVLSNHMPRDKQGNAASLVNTVVNYSISIGLGIAGTVDAQVSDDGRDILRGYRGAWYVGIGLDGLGILLAIGLIFSWRSTLKRKAIEKGQTEKEGDV